MKAFQTIASRWLLAAACLFPVASQAAGPSLLPFVGEGNLVVFDLAAGSGGWVGSVTEYSDPAAPLPMPMSLVSVVLFDFDLAAQALSGTFEFTTTDLAGSLLGTVTGTFADADVFTKGGQLSLDYLVQSATGKLAGVSGYGLSFLNFDPSATGLNNYSEEGAAVLTVVPEPATTALFAAGLLLIGLSRRKTRATLRAR